MKRRKALEVIQEVKAGMQLAQEEAWRESAKRRARMFEEVKEHNQEEQMEANESLPEIVEVDNELR